MAKSIFKVEGSGTPPLSWAKKIAFAYGRTSDIVNTLSKRCKGETIVRPVTTVFIMLALASMVTAAEPAVTPAPSVVTNIPGRRPLVVLKQIGIHGRVFLIQEDGMQILTVGIDVQVMEPKEDKVLYLTRTDKDGEFILPSLDVGLYRLKAGALIVDLRVEDPVDAPGKTRLPKNILIFMPEAMRGSGKTTGQAKDRSVADKSPKRSFSPRRTAGLRASTSDAPTWVEEEAGTM